MTGRVVVIGSGPAGAAAARELVRRRVPVTMLESGDVHPSGLLIRRVSGIAQRPDTRPSTGSPM